MTWNNLQLAKNNLKWPQTTYWPTMSKKQTERTYKKQEMTWNNLQRTDSNFMEPIYLKNNKPRCAPPPISAGGGLSLQPNFQKGGLDRISTFRGRLLEKSRVTFFRGRGCNFHIKNKLKSEMFNDKKSL